MEKRILLVDDNEEFLDSTKDVLEDLGYQVVTAINGIQALVCVQKDNFNAVLMDIKMPKMNGVEAFIKMKQLNPNVKVILFTAHSLFELIKLAREHGAFEILNKPLDMNKVLETVEKAAIAH